MDFTPASCTSCCHVNLSKNSFSNTPENSQQMFVPESECKSKAFIRNGQGKTRKNFRKMKNTQLLKTTNRRNILQTTEKEKHEGKRKTRSTKKKTTKRKKNSFSNVTKYGYRKKHDNGASLISPKRSLGRK